MDKRYHFTAEEILESLKSGFVYAPYVPMQVTSIMDKNREEELKQKIETCRNLYPLGGLYEEAIKEVVRVMEEIGYSKEFISALCGRITER